MNVLIVFIVVVFSCLLVFEPCFGAKDKEVTNDGIRVKVLGKSGKVRIARGNSSGSSPIIMEMDKIAEYAADGSTVGKNSRVKHSFNTFASLDFTFSEVNKTGKYQDIDVNSFSFEAKIGEATLKVQVSMFKDNGTVVNDNEEINVTKGMVKTDITISNWTFCNPCKKGNRDQFGENLQFTITIKGKKGPGKMKKLRNASRPGRVRAQEYDLGDKVNLIISKKYKDNDAWKDMAHGYPKLITVGPKTSFVFRFEKFNGTVFYDPTVDAANAATDDDDTTSTTPSMPSSTDAAAMVKASAFSIILLLFLTPLLKVVLHG